ncbi:MAG TPA: hypothetical protein VHJ38_16575 [Nitrososphaeraceae archaeon]|nr:hypothetical protein [Nitrososphaeraceae archaeon]
MHCDEITIYYNRKQITFISYIINNNLMSDSSNENQLNKEFKKIKEEEEKKKKLLTKLKQPENPLPVGEGHETEVIDKEE